MPEPPKAGSFPSEGPHEHNIYNANLVIYLQMMLLQSSSIAPKRVMRMFPQFSVKLWVRVGVRFEGNVL